MSDQLTGIALWSQEQAAERALLERVDGARHVKIEAARRLEVLDHEKQALDSRARQQMYDELSWRGSDLPRVVLAHRHPWFVEKVAARLQELRAGVLECVEDGAEALAAIVLHQPDLVVLGDQLTRVPTTELVERTRRLSPATVITVQVSDTARIQEMRTLGTALVVSRRIPPYEVADNALRCLHDGSQVTLV